MVFDDGLHEDANDLRAVTMLVFDEPGGRFTVRYALEAESGEARLAAGALVISLPEHRGTLQLALDGDTLKGPGQIDGKIWAVSLARTAAKSE